eukprot:1548590-Pyramimonas_sp.AAC.1
MRAHDCYLAPPDTYVYVQDGAMHHLRDLCRTTQMNSFSEQCRWPAPGRGYMVPFPLPGKIEFSE